VFQIGEYFLQFVLAHSIWDHSLRNLRNEVEFKLIFNKSNTIFEKFVVSPTIPRIVETQIHQANYNTDNSDNNDCCTYSESLFSFCIFMTYQHY